MAEAEVTLTYKSLPARATCLTLAVTLPFVLLFCIWSWAVIILAISEGTIQSGPTSVLVFAQILSLLGLAGGAFLFSDRTIFVTRQGIALPMWICPALALRSQHAWTKLKNVRYANNQLTLYFDNASPARLSLSCLTAAEVQQLLVAMDVWSGGSAQFPDIELAKAEMHLLGTSDEKQHGYTEMWEEELTRRFGATNFIPLEPEQEVAHGRFVVQRQLAFGGFSAIYLVRDSSKRQFVLKEAVIPEDADEAMFKEAVRLFEREARMLSQLNNPQIARVYDHFIDNGRHYMVLEYIQGQDLRKFVRQNGAPEEQQVVNWGSQIAEIISYLHNQSPPIIHRDISPDNLIVDDNNVIHLIDFGASNLFLGTATGTMIGKQAYMSAEQLRGKATTKSDLYGLGCTLHYLLTGHDPEALSESKPSKFLPTVNARLDDLIVRCTALEADARPESAAEVAVELNSLEKVPA
ncbi:MAG TPA: serine/threonine-protein kinase [Drouetiella sp.]